MDLHSDKTFKCNYKGCNEVFKTRERLRRHRYQHLGKYKCQFDTCNFIGESFSKLEKHKITHSDERPVKCKHCDKRFKNKYGLNGHMKTLHPDECRDLPLLVCEVKGCQYQTKSTGGFNAHKSKHNLPFECDICHKKFANKTTFTKIIDTYTQTTSHLSVNTVPKVFPMKGICEDIPNAYINLKRFRAM